MQVGRDQASLGEVFDPSALGFQCRGFAHGRADEVYPGRTETGGDGRGVTTVDVPEGRACRRVMAKIGASAGNQQARAFPRVQIRVEVFVGRHLVVIERKVVASSLRD